MAIKISGSTIIDDSRNIVNAGVTTVGVLTGTDARFSGTVEANEYLGSGIKLAGIVTSIVAGPNISVDQATGQVVITGLANTTTVISDTINTSSLNVTGITTLAGNTNISGDITSNVTIVSTDAGSSAAPEFKLYRDSASPADGDYLGQIKFAGESDTGVERNYAKITGKISDASNGTEDGIIEITHIKAGSQNISARFNSTELQLLNDTDFSVAGESTFTGTVNANGALDVDGQTDLDVLNVAELATFTDNIVANGNIVGDNSTNISGISSVTATTYYGDGSSLTGVVSGVGVQTSGGYIGSGVTALDFRGSGISTVTDPSSGFSTVFVDFNGQGAIWSKNESNFTASEGQVTFTKGYQPNNLDVYINGVRQISGDNYTATNGTSVGLTTAANAGDKVDIIAYNSSGAVEFSVARSVGLVTATSAQTVFTVPSYDLGNNSLDIFLNGIKLEPTEFTETNGTTITLAVGAGADDILEAYAYDVSGGNYWQLTGNTLHRSTYNNPVAIGTDTQNGDSYLTVGQPGAAGTSLFVHGGARITGILTVGEGSITIDGQSGSISGLSGALNVGTGTSISSSGNNDLTLGTNNTERLRIESDGDFRLSSGDAETNYGGIRGWNSSTGDMIIDADKSGTGTGGSNLIFKSRGYERMRLESDGDFRLSSDDAGSNYGGIRGWNSGTGDMIIDADKSATGTNGSNLIFKCRGTERMRLENSGRLGIGDDAPGSFVSILTSSAGSYTETGSTAGYKGLDIYNNQSTDNDSYSAISMRVARSSGNAAVGSINLLATGDGSGSFAFITRNASSFGERIRLDSSGNFGIGTDDPSNLLTVSTNTNGTTNLLKLHADADGTDNGLAGIKLSGNGGDHAAYIYGGHSTSGNSFLSFYTDLWAGSHNAVERVRIDQSGAVGINITNPSAGASSSSGIAIRPANNDVWFNHGVGAGTVYAYFAYNTSAIGSISRSGTTSVSFNTTSDYRLKENVTVINNGITRLQQLKPCKFNFIADPERTVDGFLAHEAQSVVPECVTGEKDETKEEEYEVTPAVLNDDGEEVTPSVMGTRTVPVYQGIDQSKLVPLLTAALQEAIAKIETLEQRLTDAGIA